MNRESTAATRVRTFLDTRAKMGGLDQSTVHAVNDVELTTADLHTLVMQAEALHHAAPHAAQAIEVGPS